MARDNWIWFNPAMRKACGFADRAKRERATCRTPLDTGSVTKQFTAAAVLRLEQEEKLQTADPVRRFFPAVPEERQDVTINRLPGPLRRHLAGPARGT